MSKYIDGIVEENMDLFLKSLRSGEYSQGKRQLKTAEGFCCLGVASDLAAKDGVVEKWIPEEGNGEASFDGEWFLAPESALDWMGIPESHRYSTSPRVFNVRLFKHELAEEQYLNMDVDKESSEKAVFVTASALNDSYELSLSEIANAFEKEFLK